ncbi:Testis-expressed protein 10 [Linum perenne]
MPKSKASSKKQQKRGIDFKKIKRKIGRKLPPPKNTTNTEVKSKAIVLPEQSVASEKTGLAVSKKGLTLKELLQQTSHHNAKVRKDALIGIRDLLLKFPEELKSHRYAVIEKLRERISDDDKMVRENLYQLLKSVIFPACQEDSQGPLISMVMAYIFNAMTHLAIDVRLMAFKFFNLIVEYHPDAFVLHAEKILQNYENILRSNQFDLQYKTKLRNVLAGLVCCLSLLPCAKKEFDSSGQDALTNEVLHAYEPDEPTESVELSIIDKKLKELLPVLLSCFQDFIPSTQGMSQMDAQSFDCMLSTLQSIGLAVRFFIYGIGKDNLDLQRLDGSREVYLWDHRISPTVKKLLGLFPLNSTRDHSGKDDDRYFILNTLITEIFLCTKEWIEPSADMFVKYLAFMKYVLETLQISDKESGKTAIREKHMLPLIPFLPKLVSQVTENWKAQLLQAFTKTFQDCSPDSKIKMVFLQVIEEMLLSGEAEWDLNASNSELFNCQISWMRELPQLLIQLGDRNPSSSQAVLRLILRLGQHSGEYDNLQYSLEEFYSTSQQAGKTHYGPFIKLPRVSQELSLCCLYYFSHLDSALLRSLASCICLSHELDESLILRIIELLQSCYCAGHFQITDHISFFATLLSRFVASPESISHSRATDAMTNNHGILKSMTSAISNCLSQLGDKSLVLFILEGVILEQLSLKPSLHNACAMLRVLIVLDSKPTKLSEHSIQCLGNYLAGYLIDVVQQIQEDSDPAEYVEASRYYLVPCFFLFDRSHRILDLILTTMVSLIQEHITSVSPNDDAGSRVSSKIESIVGVLLLMHREAKIWRLVCSSKDDLAHISRSVQSLLDSEFNLTIEGRHRVQQAFDRLQTVTRSLRQESQIT